MRIEDRRWLKAYEKNERACRFYARMGFRIVNEERDEHSEREHHMVSPALFIALTL